MDLYPKNLCRGWADLPGSLSCVKLLFQHSLIQHLAETADLVSKATGSSVLGEVASSLLRSPQQSAGAEVFATDPPLPGTRAKKLSLATRSRGVGLLAFCRIR